VHAYAKLRLHTEDTLASFDIATSELRRALRDFVNKTYSAIVTREFSREEAARLRRNAAMTAKKGEAQGAKGRADAKGKKPPRAKGKAFNRFTYKLHALGA
jgi:hypothetical protein